jgi:hypothetical protein
MPTVDLLHADCLALLQLADMGWVADTTAALSLRAKGLLRYDDEGHKRTTAEGDEVADLVRGELHGDRISMPTALHPGIMFRQHLGDTPRTVDHIDCDDTRLWLWRVHTVEPWPVAGDTDRRWRDVSSERPILIHTPDDWSLDQQMEMPI